MKLKNRGFDWIKTGKCPCCDSTIEFITTDNNGILVNCETKGRVNIPKFWMMSTACGNPLCKWSTIKEEVDKYNLCDTKAVWSNMKWK